MIARTWRGATRAADADRYAAYMHETGLREYQATPGNRGAMFLRRIDGDRAEFLVVSLWESLDAIRAFAGDQIGRAVFYPLDDEMLVDRDLEAHHWEVTNPVGGIAADG